MQITPVIHTMQPWALSSNTPAPEGGYLLSENLEYHFSIVILLTKCFLHQASVQLLFSFKFGLKSNKAITISCPSRLGMS